MDTTITVLDALLMVLVIVCVVLVIYLITMVKKLNKTLTKVDSVLDDAKVVTEVAAEKAKQVDAIITDTAASMNALACSVKNSGLVAAVGSFASTISSIIGFIKGKGKSGK